MSRLLTFALALAVALPIAALCLPVAMVAWLLLDDDGDPLGPGGSPPEDVRLGLWPEIGEGYLIRRRVGRAVLIPLTRGERVVEAN